METYVQSTDYMLGRSLSERHRLRLQGRLISDITRHFLEAIGLSDGMRVLDVGSGVGDVAVLATRLVGPSGEVVGIDSDPAVLELARQRAADEGLANLRFQICDLREHKTSSYYDAVIGRCILLHQTDPLSTVKEVLNYVRPGGTVAFQEPCFSRAFSLPEAPLFQEVLRQLHEVMAASGFDRDVGARLPSLFLAAGLPRPKLSFEMLLDSGPGSEIYDLCVDTMQSLLPKIENLGISSAEKIRIDSLDDRLRTEASTLNSTIGVMPLVGAWSVRQ